MADIFISYSKFSASVTRELAEELEAKGFSVWWDTDLVTGDRFSDIILAELAKAKAVIVIWSPASVQSDWVMAEARRARESRKLIPVRTEDLGINEIPPPFDVLHTELVSNRRSIDAALLKFGLSAKNTVAQDHLVLLVHGINTRAHWMDGLKPTLRNVGFDVAATSFGRFSVPRFLAPFLNLRRKAIQRVVDDIHSAISIYRRKNGAAPKQMSVIAHSFGTYIISQILSDHPEFKWHRIIFCGSVIRDDYSFKGVLDRFDEPLLNEVGTKDFWPAIAESAGWGYGSVGSNGFNSPADPNTLAPWISA